MHCANPDCRAPAIDLSAGVLRLVELDVAPEERVIRSDAGFPVCSVPSRYFWLCPKCSTNLRVRRWTSAGLIFETKRNQAAIESSERSLPSLQPVPRKLLTATRKTA